MRLLIKIYISFYVNGLTYKAKCKTFAYCAQKPDANLFHSKSLLVETYCTILGSILYFNYNPPEAGNLYTQGLTWYYVRLFILEADRS